MVPAYGTSGEFNVGSEGTNVRAQYLLTKIRPGSTGAWENVLAAHMAPWRELFNVDELSFDELLQRNLDDSRVAHDLVPYLLGSSSAVARFFPPILAVLVPKHPRGAGVKPFYPEPRTSENGVSSYGQLFDFSHVIVGSQQTPASILRFNPQTAGLVIVDGQHRAMAVLAIHRQLNNTWGGNPYASYYSHLQIPPDAAQHIELPVCIVFFPDLHEGNNALAERGIDLRLVSRELFLVVNRSAKPVSPARELLLDDEDFAARMMRRTLSVIKKRGDDGQGDARIYTFAYGESGSERGQGIVTGQLEYSSAVALHRLHAATAFAIPNAFSWEKHADVTDGRYVRNSERPSVLLLGTSLEHFSNLQRRSAKSHLARDADEATKLLGSITDDIILPLFDSFLPFKVQNASLLQLRDRLRRPEEQGDPLNRKCYSLLFEGNDVRTVFDEHLHRLKTQAQDLASEGEEVDAYVDAQIQDARLVRSALGRYEDELRRVRAADLLQVPEHSMTEEEVRKAVIARARTIFDTTSTQAFQLGYLMAVHTVAETLITEETDSYDDRLRLVRFLTELYVSSLNAYFTDPDPDQTLGFLSHQRSGVFDTKELGLRGFLSLSVRELNERQWPAFRYVVLELAHSTYAQPGFASAMEHADDDLRKSYREKLSELVAEIVKLRDRYRTAAISAALRASEFRLDIERLKAEAHGRGDEVSEIEQRIEEREEERRREVRTRADDNLIASLGSLEDAEDIYERLLSAIPG